MSSIGVQFTDTYPTIKSFNDFSDEALQGLRNWLEINPPTLPISQIVGFSQFTANAARTPDESTTTSTTYADPTSGVAGPEVDSLPDGHYVCFFGASTTGISSDNTVTFTTVEVNGVVPSDDLSAIEAQQDLHASVSGAVLLDLKGGGNNTVKLVYRTTTGTGVDIRSRWIVMLRYSNA